MKPSHSATVSAATMTVGDCGFQVYGLGFSELLMEPARAFGRPDRQLGPGGAGLTANAAFDIGGGQDDGETVAGGFEQLAPPWRTAGEDEAKGLGIGGWGLRRWHVTFLGVGGTVLGVGSRFSNT